MSDFKSDRECVYQLRCAVACQNFFRVDIMMDRKRLDDASCPGFRKCNDLLMMNKMKLSTKLIGGFCLVAFITLAVGLTGWKSTSNVIAQLNTVTD